MAGCGTKGATVPKVAKWRLAVSEGLWNFDEQFVMSILGINMIRLISHDIMMNIDELQLHNIVGHVITSTSSTLGTQLGSTW